MILAKAPLRVSFFGGGSDIEDHYSQYGGDVISTAIDKYVYVAINKTPHKHIKVSYSEQELVYDVDYIKNDIVRNVLKYFNIKSGIDISTFADIPTVGTGLAGSSAFTCALISAIAKYKDITFNEFELAEGACHIEINLCGWRIGKQDQYASAFGGMNHFHFHKDSRVSVKKMDPFDIDQNMILIPTNIQRHASDILENIDFNKKSEQIKKLARYAKIYSDHIPDSELYGKILNNCWLLKKQMNDNISNPEIDDIYYRCMAAGSLGCKLLGAGGGGYMLAITNEKEKIKEEFFDRTCLDVNISNQGARVIYYD